MNNEKLETLLNLSLDATMTERDKSLELNVGYDKEEGTWELIVKYHGDLARAASERIQIELLNAGYAIVTLPQSLVEAFANLEEVEYIEKPKRLYFNVANGKQASCILPVTIRDPFLTGKGTIVAIIDSGIDYTHADFRTKSGNSRILTIWDQTINPSPEKGWYPPKGFLIGVEFDKGKIDEALLANSRKERYEIVPSVDISGHGTAVAGIAAGNGLASDGLYTGVAPESELLIVKLGTGSVSGFPKTTELMRAITYVFQVAIRLGRPIAVNLSFGNTYGAHDGTSLLERYIDNVSEIGKGVICVGSGNEGASAGHISGRLNKNQEEVLELSIAPYEMTTSVQIWKNYVDEFDLLIRSPGGEEKRIDLKKSGTERIVLEGTKLLIYVGTPSPYSVNQEIFIDFIPIEQFITSGIWVFTLVPETIVTGFYRFYLPSEVVRNSGTRFFKPNPNATLTIPSTASKVVTVGAYDTVYDAYVDFSGRGFFGENRIYASENVTLVKPDLVAPGVDIISTTQDDRYGTYTGTSFATPFVTGSAALLMEWGIIRNKDPFLYGEKVRAYLVKGARQLPGFEVFPNALVGYGALCLNDSLPG